MSQGDTADGALRALDGFTIGVTADRRADEQAELLRRHGARVIHGPAVSITPLADEATLRAATQRVIGGRPDLLLANTGIGMRTWLAAAEAWDLDRALLASLGGARIAARGPKAAGALQQLGLPIWRLEPSERLATMIETLDPATLDGANVVLQEYGEAAPWAEAMLAAAGARVTVVPVYRCAGPADPDPALRLIEAAVDGRLDAITFTSPPAARTFMRLAGEAGMADALQDALRRVVVAAVGPMTAEALAAEGVDECIAPSRGRLGLMVRCLTDALSERSHHLAAAGATVTVQGAVVARGSVRVELSERERAVLHVLLRRPGAVVSKDALLREVWRGDGSSHKNVESTVGRLRRRLEPAGLSIAALARRGYRLEMAGAAG